MQHQLAEQWSAGVAESYYYYYGGESGGESGSPRSPVIDTEDYTAEDYTADLLEGAKDDQTHLRGARKGDGGGGGGRGGGGGGGTPTATSVPTLLPTFGSFLLPSPAPYAADAPPTPQPTVFVAMRDPCYALMSHLCSTHDEDMSTLAEDAASNRFPSSVPATFESCEKCARAKEGALLDSPLCSPHVARRGVDLFPGKVITSLCLAITGGPSSEQIAADNEVMTDDDAAQYDAVLAAFDEMMHE
jgi:hypothetical protein